ncbi:TetR/AcrR family transcriptional regulator [Haloechinothrix sp. LS1_15]|nr:TetR/AcrR family transcriptional regulator [Haloechinothrix sp. LS1_15]
MAQESTRRRLSPRQADTVRRLTDAAVEELRAVGYSALTVRNVAARGGVAPATAYTYFSSKNHLVTEVFWRRLRDLPQEATAEPSAVGRVVTVLRQLALLVVDEPELASACTAALLGDDPDVIHLREEIGREWHRRLSEALGEDADPAVLRTLETSLVGAFIHTGLGYGSYERMADQLESSARLIMEGRS